MNMENMEYWKLLKRWDREKAGYEGKGGRPFFPY